MSPNLSKVVYKPDTQSTDEYIIVVNPDQLKKWKEGDTTIPLADVVDSFNIYHSNQGAQGILRTPSKQQLESTFGTSKDVEVIQYMLGHGKEQPAEGFKATATKNVARSSVTIDTRGKSSFGGV